MHSTSLLRVASSKHRNNSSAACEVLHLYVLLGIVLYMMHAAARLVLRQKQPCFALCKSSISKPASFVVAQAMDSGNLLVMACSPTSQSG